MRVSQAEENSQSYRETMKNRRHQAYDNESFRTSYEHSLLLLLLIFRFFSVDQEMNNINHDDKKKEEKRKKIERRSQSVTIKAE